MAFRTTFYEPRYEKYYTEDELIAQQQKLQSEFTTDILQGEYGDIWKDTLTKWRGKEVDTSGFKTQIVSELTSNDNMKIEMIEKAVQFGVYFRWSTYLKDRNMNEDLLESLKYQLEKTFDDIMQLLKIGVEDIPIAWNSLKKYSKKSYSGLGREWDTKRAINDDEDIRRAIVKKTAAKFVNSEYYKQKLEAWVSIEGNKQKKKVKKRIVDELKNDMPTSIDVIAYAIKQTDMQKDHKYTDMSTDDSDFDHMLVYIFNSIATVLAAGATNTRSAWDKLKENENEKKYVIALFNVKAAVKSIVRPEPARVYSDPMDDPMDIIEENTPLAALLQLLQSHISL